MIFFYGWKVEELLLFIAITSTGVGSGFSSKLFTISANVPVKGNWKHLLTSSELAEAGTANSPLSSKVRVWWFGGITWSFPFAVFLLGWAGLLANWVNVSSASNGFVPVLWLASRSTESTWSEFIFVPLSSSKFIRHWFSFLFWVSVACLGSSGEDLSLEFWKVFSGFMYYDQ